MRTFSPTWALAALIMLGAGVFSVLAQETAPAAAVQSAKGDKPSSLTPADQVAVTSGSVAVGGKALAYTATTGYLPLKEEGGKLRANIFHVAYTLKESGVRGQGSEANPATQAAGSSTQPSAARPVTFVFNGGPGAAAVWLHLGTAGPQRIDIPADGSPPKAPYTLVENEFTWLPSTDLVFVDPVNTGYSRAASSEIAKEFFGVKEDIAGMGEFVRLWLTKNQRWNSPIFLAGESYGTTRAAGLSDHLQQKHGITVSGVILISTVLNFATLSPQEGNDLPYVVYLPGYTALAHHHGKIKGDRAKLLLEAEEFASSDYVVALTKGASLPEEQREKIAARVAALTGLTKAYVRESDLRIPPSRFMKELLREQQKIIGRFDGRLAGAQTDAVNDSAEWDPSFDGFFTAYSGAINDYVRKTLKYENDVSYEVLTNKVHPWNYGGGGFNGYLYVGDSLRDAMSRNPRLQLLVAAGWYDLATPYYGADYTVNQLGLAKELRKNITQTYYPAGHMMYHERTSLAQLQKDIAALIQKATR